MLENWTDKNKLSDLIYGVRNLLKNPDENYAFENSRAYNSFMCEPKHYRKRAVEWTAKYAWDPEWAEENKGDDEIE